MNKYFYLTLSLSIIITFFYGCSKTLSNQEKDFFTTDNQNVNELIKSIEKINSNTPSSFSADINIDGHSGKQKFKAEGDAQFVNNPRKMRVVFHDAVFKSTITEIIQDGDIIRIYFPFDKILYIDNIRTINLKFYSDIDMDYNLISDLSTGRIPVIKDYTVKKGLESKKGNGQDDNKLVILENEEYFETISFSNNIPDRILWLNKNTKDKLEVYFKEPFRENELLFYKLIKVVSVNTDLNITIQFNSLKLNVPLEPDNISNINLPKDGKVINRSIAP